MLRQGQLVWDQSPSRASLLAYRLSRTNRKKEKSPARKPNKAAPKENTKETRNHRVFYGHGPRLGLYLVDDV